MDLSYLVNQIKAPQTGLQLRQGKVITVNANYTMDVQIAGDTNTLPSVRYLSNFPPKPNDQVWLINDGADLLGIGMVAGAGRTLAPRTTRATPQSIPHNTQTAISWSSAENDDWSCWSASYPTRLTAPISGRYLLAGACAFDASNNGNREIRFVLNGSGHLYSTTFDAVTASLPSQVTLVGPPLTLTKGEYVEMSVWQNTNSNLNLVIYSQNAPTFSLIYLGS